jgi:hypothetical protein
LSGTRATLLVETLGICVLLLSFQEEGKYSTTDYQIGFLKVNSPSRARRKIEFFREAGGGYAERGEHIIGCATTGSSARCTVLLGVTTDGENMPLFIIYKGANTPHSKINNEWKDAAAREKFGYQEGLHYTVQAKAWMDQARMKEWVFWI